MTVEEKLRLRRVVTPEGCWRWTGAHSWNGYGLVSVGRTNKRAHRVAYALWVGPIPEGLEIDHLCGVRDCFNPDHLDAVTQLENLRRRRRRPRVSKTHCRPGRHVLADVGVFERDGKCKACNRDRVRRQRARRAALAGEPS